MFACVENTITHITFPPSETIEGVQMPFALEGSSTVAVYFCIFMNPGCASDAANIRRDPGGPCVFAEYAISKQFNAP